MPLIGQWKDRLDEFIWERDTTGMPSWECWLVRALRLVYVIVRDLAEGQLNLRAMSLVYTTLLSFVPLLAFSFSVMKGLGVHNRLEPLLYEALSYLGPRGEELGDRVMGFVENVRADVLGTVGLALLIYLVISLVQKVESAFNYVWHVQRARSLAQRFSNYLSVILIGPLFIAAALAITGTVTGSGMMQDLMQVEPIGSLLVILSRLVPYLIVIGVFTFIYIFVPNADVHFRAALAGGVVGGVVWQTAGWVFASFIAGSAKYVAIYSSFAIVLTLMIWVYLNWLILLLGAQVAFYFQKPGFVEKSRGRLTLSNRLRERLALEVMYLVGKAFQERGAAVWNIERLSERLRIPADLLATITGRLERAGLLFVTDEPKGRFVPGADLLTISLEDVRAAVRRADPELDHDERRVPISSEVARCADEADEAARERLAGKNLHDVVRGKR